MNPTTENQKGLLYLNQSPCTTPSTCACHLRWIPTHLRWHKANATQLSGPQKSHNGQKSRHGHPSLDVKDGYVTPPFTFNHPDNQLKVVTVSTGPRKKQSRNMKNK